MTDSPTDSTNEPTAGSFTPPTATPETAAAVHELLDLVQGLDAKFTAGEHALAGELALLEAYKWMFTILRVGMDAFVWGDAANPRFVDIVGPYEKWGGDNADAFYQYVPIDPARTYRVRGRTGDAVYCSLTVYGGPDDGRYSERIVGSVNNRELDVAPDGTFAFTLSPEPFDGPGITLEPDAVCAITRDYLEHPEDPSANRRVEWAIDVVGRPETVRPTDADLARRFRAVTTWVREQWNLVPIALGEPNRVDAPYPVPAQTFGWAAGDAAYAMGSFDLGEDDALVIDGRSPECAFWNLCLWNQLLHTFNYDYERVTINGAQIAPNDDGSWTIVVAHRDPGHPNWVSTQGHRQGLLWFRWFLPASTPDQPAVRVVPVQDVTGDSISTPKRSM